MKRSRQMKMREAMPDSFDKPITVWELAHIVADRRGDVERHRSTHDAVRHWIEEGHYGLRLHTWAAPGTRMTTLRKYLEFRRQVADARRRARQGLMDSIAEKRGWPRKKSAEKPVRRALAVC